MVSHPERWISDFALAGCNMYTFHIESTSTPHVLIQEIKKSGMRVGVALKPGTSVESVVGVCESVDMVLVMTVGTCVMCVCFCVKQNAYVRAAPDRTRVWRAIVYA